MFSILERSGGDSNFMRLLLEYLKKSSQSRLLKDVFSLIWCHSRDSPIVPGKKLAHMHAYKEQDPMYTVMRGFVFNN